MSNYIEEMYKFVQTQVAAVYSTSNVTLSVSTSKSDPDSVINDTLRDLRIGSRLSLPEVSTSSLISHPLLMRELQT